MSTELGTVTNPLPSPVRSGRGKWTPEIRDRLTAAVRAGTPIATACKFAGISYRTLREYIAIAEAPPPSPRQYPDRAAFNAARRRYAAVCEFVAALRRAEAEVEAASLARIRRAGANGDWRADAWFLERRYPDEYGRRAVDVTGTITVEDAERHAQRLNVALMGALDDAEIDEETRGRIMEAMAARLRELTSGQ